MVLFAHHQNFPFTGDIHLSQAWEKLNMINLHHTAVLEAYIYCLGHMWLIKSVWQDELEMLSILGGYADELYIDGGFREMSKWPSYL